MKELPNKAKLITDNGFTKMIDNPTRTPVINVPIIKRIRYSTIELSDFDLDLSVSIQFRLEKVYKKYAVYRQTGVVNIIN